MSGPFLRELFASGSAVNGLYADGPLFDDRPHPISPAALSILLTTQPANWKPHTSAASGKQAGWQNVTTGEVVYEAVRPGRPDEGQPPTGTSGAHQEPPKAREPRKEPAPLPAAPPAAPPALQRPAQAAPPPRAPAPPQANVDALRTAQLEALKDPNHPLNRYKGQLEDVDFQGRKISTLRSTPEHPLSPQDHVLLQQSHARAGAQFKAAGYHAEARGQLAAARYHGDMAQGKSEPQPAPTSVLPPESQAAAQALRDKLQERVATDTSLADLVSGEATVAARLREVDEVVGKAQEEYLALRNTYSPNPKEKSQKLKEISDRVIALQSQYRQAKQASLEIKRKKMEKLHAHFHAIYAVPQEHRGSVSATVTTDPAGVIAGNWAAAEKFLAPLLGQHGPLDVSIHDVAGPFPISNYQQGPNKTGKLSLVPADGPAIAAHEFGHHLERLPGVIERVREFKSRRFRDEDNVMSNQLGNPSPDPYLLNPDDMKKLFTPENGYPYKSDREWKSAYVGREYAHGTTEIISMGLELLYQDPVFFAKTDPEYFDLVMDTLQNPEPKP